MCVGGVETCVCVGGEGFARTSCEVVKYSNRFSARRCPRDRLIQRLARADEAQHKMSTVAPTNAAGAAYAEHSNNWRKVKQMSLKMIATHHVARQQGRVEPTGEDLRWRRRCTADFKAR